MTPDRLKTDAILSKHPGTSQKRELNFVRKVDRCAAIFSVDSVRTARRKVPPAALVVWGKHDKVGFRIQPGKGSCNGSDR